MNSYVRVFLKGEPKRFVDFPLEAGITFPGFVRQVKFEGYALGSHICIMDDQIAAMMLVQTTAPMQTLHGMAPTGQA
jgi:hypothetical protein